jgi:hypothetical protein
LERNYCFIIFLTVVFAGGTTLEAIVNVDKIFNPDDPLFFCGLKLLTEKVTLHSG